MNVHDIRDKVSAHLQTAKRRLSSSKTGEKQQRLDIDTIIGLHYEAEMATIAASVQQVTATGDSEANSRPVRMLDFDCITWQGTFGNQSSAHKPLETRNYACL